MASSNTWGSLWIKGNHANPHISALLKEEEKNKEQERLKEKRWGFFHTYWKPVLLRGYVTNI